MLDLYSELARIVRGGDASDLNDRLRLVFDCFEVATLPDGKVGVMPVLRNDLVERFADPNGRLSIVTSDGGTLMANVPPSAVQLLVLDDEQVTTWPNA